MRALFTLCTAVVFSCIFEISQAQCNGTSCNGSVQVTTTTTSISVATNCRLSLNGSTDQSSVLTGLIPGEVFAVQAHCFNCCLSATTKPETVQGLNISITTSSLILNWTEPNGRVSGYNVIWSGDGQNGTKTTNQTELEISDLSSGVAYMVAVRAVAADGRTEGTEVSSSRYTKPESVLNLTVTDVTTSSLSLNWTKPQGHSSIYSVQWADGGYSKEETVTETFKVISNLTSGVEYNITITAVAGDGKTRGSGVSISQFTKPESVLNLTVTDVTTSSLSLNWTKPQGLSSIYSVQWADGGYSKEETVTETFKVISNLTSGVEYNITITAVAGDGKTKGSGVSISQFTKPESVLNLTVTDVTTSSLSLNWTKPQGHSSIYSVQWADGGYSKEETVTETFKVISNLTSGVEYNITITAVAGDGKTKGSGVSISQFTKPESVLNLTVTDVTTSSLSLNWTKPQGLSSIYSVQWADGGYSKEETVTETFKVISNLTSGVEYNITITAVAGDGKTRGSGVSISQFTKPESVLNLTVTDVTTSSLSLNWTKPQGHSSIYSVQWADGGYSKEETVTETFKVISNLTSGVEYNITITAVAGDGKTRGSGVSISQFTMPEQPVDVTAHQRTDSLNISWILPKGRVDHFEIQLGLKSNQTTSSWILFTDLSPGRLFHVTVVAVAGELRASSNSSTFATYPLPPQHINVTSRTNSSLDLSWSVHPQMLDAPNISYNITYWGDPGLPPGQASSVNNSTTLSLPHSGTQYDISVETVGPLDLLSENVTIRACTNPNPVLNLRASPETNTSVKVEWSYPWDNKPHYSYIILIHHNDTVRNQTVEGNFSSVTGLDPGTKYQFAVTTMFTPECQSTPEVFHSFTKPNAVSDLEVQTVNTTSVNLTWWNQIQYGSPSLYLVQVYRDSELVYNDSTGAQSYTITGLTPGEIYTFTVIVEVENVQSDVKSITDHRMNPAAVTDLQTSGSTTNLTVSWTLADGRVDNYTAVLYNKTQQVRTEQNLSNNTFSTTFTELRPGLEYCVEVFAQSGSLISNRTGSCNATFPNPPGEVVVSQTERSILFTWDTPEDMEADQYYFTVTTFIGTDFTQNNSFALEDLEPGSPYTISVATVGDYNYSSEEVTETAFTKPAAVTNLEFSGSTTNLTVSWTRADGRVDNYTATLYEGTLQVQPEQNISNDTFSTTFTDLKPGRLYCAKVVTKSGPFESTATESCSPTFPNPPGSIRVTSQTERSLTFAWDAPEDIHPDQYIFNVTINGNDTVQQNTSNITLNDLESGSPYDIHVVTVAVNDLASEGVQRLAYTKPYAVTELRQTEITVDSVSLMWNQTEYKSDYSFLVEVSDVFSNISRNFTRDFTRNITRDFTYTAESLISGTNYSFSVTTLTADGTKASSETVSYFTRPYSVGALTANTINTTSIDLTWDQPQQYKPEYTYVVKTSGCIETHNKCPKVREESMEISDLTPGTNYSFCVTVMAADGTEGTPDCTTQYTYPAKAALFSSEVTNCSMQVSWAKPPGNVEYFTAEITSSNHSETSGKLNSSDRSYSFNNLRAGRSHTAVVKTHSGPYESSESVTIATLPNAPGAIHIESKTTGSIHISWEEAPLMTGAKYHYLIEITPGEYNFTQETNYEFDGLMSGTSYNVSVTTVSAPNFTSKSVRKDMITTKPFSVKTLTSDPSEKSVGLSWDKPDEHKPSYRFKVTALNSTGAIIQENTTQNPLYTFSSLDPGTSYRFSVTTETADGTEGASEETSSCTDASVVKSLSCKAPNDPNATITWFWEKPNGGVSNFSVQFEKNTTYKKCCSFTKGYLKHFTDYTANVTTQSCGKPSVTVSKTCKTGITAPRMPENYKSMLSLRNLKYNEFTIDINLSLLNNSYGPIKYVGVLVTEKAMDVSQSDVAQYLENTYEQWKAKEVNVYLASVIETGENGRTRRSTENSLAIDVGAETVWNNYYLNGRLEATKQYNFAIVLFTNLTTAGPVINADWSLFSYTHFDNVVILPPNPTIIGIAVGATLGIFCVLLFVLIGFIIYWRRLSSKESSDIQVHSLRAKVSFPVRVEDYEVYYKKQKADSNCGFASEYEDLKVVGTAQSKMNALNPENKPKNRYNNVLPFDASRVKLSIIHGNPIDDYINANYIPGYNCRKEFIAAQGPLPTTVDDFWRMMWEKNVHTMVMLTRCNEQGRVKCEQYWTPGTRHYGNITVTMTSEIPLEDWTIRDFDIKNVKTAETRPVRHFHFTAWPDHGVPETTELLISFRHLVREHMDQYRHSPTVVHCSAGVGRTGTFIAIDRLIFQIERENVVDVYGIVHDMRMHRVLMVQTEDQFVFLNQCALDIIRSRTGNNVDLIYQNTAAFSIYENIELQKR